MKKLRLVFFAAVCGAAPAAAAPVDFAGTWECRQPGMEYKNKPPILYVADVAGPESAEVTIEVDGFGREVYGRSAVSTGEGGWWKVHPAQGQDFMIRPDAGSARTPAMALRWPDSKTDYRCLRLPLLVPQGTAPAKVNEEPAKPEEGAAKQAEEPKKDEAPKKE